LAISAVLIAAVAGSDGDVMSYWPAWRGPLSSGVAPHGKPPVEWSETENIRWKVKLPGPGHATPVVWSDRIYLLSAVKTEKTVAAPEEKAAAPDPSSSRSATSSATILPASWQQEAPQQERQRGEQPRSRGRREPPPKPTHIHQFVVSALDRGTGEAIWQTVVREELPHEPGHPTASQASASPVTDGEHIWASFGSHGLYCLDKNGKVKWEKDLGEMSTRNQFGEGSSPVLHGDTIVVNWDHEGDSFIVALDKRTGEQRWKVARDEPTSWSTPLVVRDGARALVVVSASNRVRAYDLKTGEEVWRCGGLGLNCAPTPVADSGLVFVMSGWREAAGMAIRYPGARGDLTDSDAVAWQIDSGLSYVPSPLLYDGKLYFLERFKGMLSCYDLKTGEAHYTQQRLEGLGNIYASPVGADGRIYLVDRNGTAIVFRHGEQFDLLARNKLDDGFDASPVIVGSDLYLRGHTYLYNVATVPSPRADRSPNGEESRAVQ
jgi:outer membrane protein assembly factor BamB